MRITFRQMTIDDYDQVYGLWAETAGLSLQDADSREGIARYLRRNRGLCFVARAGGQIVGTVLCGHDGRRGFLRHLAIRPAFRGRGIARALVSRCLAGLAKQGIARCNTFVLDDNMAGRRFWEHLGWRLLEYHYRTLQTLTNEETTP